MSRRRFRLRLRPPARFGAFAVVGAVGFLVDAGVLTALVNGLGANPYAARAVSFPAAVTATWWLNRRWTFAPAGIGTDRPAVAKNAGPGPDSGGPGATGSHSMGGHSMGWRGMLAEYARYVGVQTTGALINLGVYALCVAADPALGAYPVVPLAAGSAVALLYNFAASRHFVFSGAASGGGS